MKSFIEHIAEALDGSQMKYSGKNCEFVDVILEDPDGKILILRRANYMKNFRTCWGVIGGAVDVADKTPKDAAVRETAEETGISLSFNEVNNMKLLFDYKYKDGNVSHVFWTKLETKIDKVKISREHSKYEWIDFSEEKIDDRKWMPEVFNILQKWEHKSINEKLLVNKNFKSFNELDDLIDKVVNFKEADVVSTKLIPRVHCDVKITKLFKHSSFLLNDKEINDIIDEVTKYVNIGDGKCYSFASGEFIKDHSVVSRTNHSESIENLIHKILNNKIKTNFIWRDVDIDGMVFRAYYVLGEKYMFVTIGSHNLRYSWISNRPSNITEKLIINKTYNSGKVKPKDDNDFMKIIDDTMNEHFKKYGEHEGNFEVIDFNFIDTSDVKDFSYMFDATCDKLCKKITKMDISNWDMSSATDLHGMFCGCSALTSIGDISNWDVSNVKDFSKMFMDCFHITEIGDLSRWDVSSSKKFNRMFAWCEKLENIGNISGWNLQKYKHDIQRMFYAANKIKNLPSWYDRDKSDI